MTRWAQVEENAPGRREDARQVTILQEERPSGRVMAALTILERLATVAPAGGSSSGVPGSGVPGSCRNRSPFSPVNPGVLTGTWPW